jgi:3-deoxy-7-phosphoheptulonate synthase
MNSVPLLPGAARGTTRRVRIGDAVIGGPAVPVIAGPCAVEWNYVEHAASMAQHGAKVLRGCVFKPRTHPDSFQGIGVDGLPLLDAARRETGLPVLSEPLSSDDVARLHGHVDALLIGARSMHNTPLLRAAGRSGLPVILKRGMSATYDELLAAAQYLTVEGNDQVILCERGIRTFETSTRNTLDLSAVTVLRERTDLPIAIDPSHATGNAAWVPSLAIAAVAAGADALLVECHPEPHNSLCDAAQAITPATLDEIVRACDVLAPLTRPMALGGVAATRQAIDALDGVLIRLIEQRAGLVSVVQGHKRTAQLPPRDSKREGEIVERLHELAPSLGRTRVRHVVRAVIDTCLESAHDADKVSAALKLNEDIA